MYELPTLGARFWTVPEYIVPPPTIETVYQAFAVTVPIFITRKRNSVHAFSQSSHAIIVLERNSLPFAFGSIMYILPIGASSVVKSRS